MSVKSPTERGLPAHDPVSRFVATLVDRVIRAVPILEPSPAPRRDDDPICRSRRHQLGALCACRRGGGLVFPHPSRPRDGCCLRCRDPHQFALHRAFTFHSLGLLRADGLRYVLLQFTSFIVCLMTMALCVDLIGLPYAVGIIGAVVLIPIVSFFVMDRWVFAQKAI